MMRCLRRHWMIGHLSAKVVHLAALHTLDSPASVIVEGTLHVVGEQTSSLAVVEDDGGAS